MTINPDGFVAKYLIARCAEASYTIEPVIEDYSCSIGKECLEFGKTLTEALNASQDVLWKIPPKTFFTSYNPEVGQTDNSPCIGASGVDQCKLAKTGVRMIALSQDMVGRAEWKEYHYGETVRLYSDNEQCNGEFLVVDTMNKRYTNRGDIFCMDRSCNTSCWATITKLTN